MTKDGYLPLAQPKGCGQVDFGEFLYYDTTGAEKKGYALTVSFPYSNKGYTQAFPSQNQECLLEGMKRIFERIVGVPIPLRFDNMTTAVAQVLKGKAPYPKRKKGSGTTVFVRPLCRKRSPRRSTKSTVAGPVNGHEKCSVWALQITETRLLKAKWC